MALAVRDKRDLAEFFERHRSSFSKCLEPDFSCSNPAIRAHSIQNAKVLDIISHRGHVLMFKLEFSKTGPEVVLKSVGRNLASTFLGFCAHHDAEIFRRIDVEDFDLTDPEHLFLIAYRSVSRELFVCMEGAGKVQSAYMSRVAKGLDDANNPSEAGMFAVNRMYVAYETYRYRLENFDPMFLTRDYSKIQHDLIVLDRKPTVAVSSLFSIDDIPSGDGVVMVVLNIFPISNEQTAIVFSYADQDAAPARAALDRILTTTGDFQRYELSKLIIERLENFVLSPAHVAAWSEEKIEVIKRAFTATLLENGITDDLRLMLF